MENEKIVAVMKRYELKYILSKHQFGYLVNALEGYMKVDKYGLTSIASLYFDTPDYHLINRSIEKPKFKEKLRLRSYGLAGPESKTFLEIKRKCEGIVYKRRISLTEKEASALIEGKATDKKGQIERELLAFLGQYRTLEPKYLIIYDRLAYYQKDSDLRITIDSNPRYRVDDLNLHTSLDGIPLLEEGSAILEVKVQISLPLWLSEILSRGRIFQSSFSKVGAAHKMETGAQPRLETGHYGLMNTHVKGGLGYGLFI